MTRMNLPRLHVTLPRLPWPGVGRTGLTMLIALVSAMVLLTG